MHKSAKTNTTRMTCFHDVGKVLPNRLHLYVLLTPATSRTHDVQALYPLKRLLPPVLILLPTRRPDWSITSELLE
jgi:hypothetical protein